MPILARLRNDPVSLRPADAAPRRRWRVAAVLLALAVPWLASQALSDAAPPRRLAQNTLFPRAELFIESAQREYRFEVEVASTMAQRASGLMFRTELAPDAGMLFVFDTVGPLTMWMKNTYISLDMLFVAADGRIARIARNTTPFSERMIASGGPVRAVVELPGGTASKLGIKPGDRVRSDALTTAP